MAISFLRCTFIIAAIAAVPAVAAASAPQRAPGDEDIQAGYRLLWSGDKAAAAEHFQRLIDRAPDQLSARFGWLVVGSDRVDADPGLEPAFEQRLDDFIDRASTRYARNKEDAEALLYLAKAHILRAQYRFGHDKGLWGAARDGAKAKGYIDAYLKDHPDEGDAYLVLGIYNYYADLAPTFLKVLRLMLFLPPGNRVDGLKQIERAAAEGTYFRPRAEMLLVEIYSTFEGRAAEALAISERLRQEFPVSDAVSFTIAELYSSPSFESFDRAAAAYQEVVDRRRVDSSPDGSAARYLALFGLSDARFNQWRLDDAIAALAAPIAAGVRNPSWVLPQFLLRRGNYRALIDDPAAAEDARRILADPQATKWHQAARDQLKWIADRKTSGEAAIYSSLIPGNRLVADGKWDEARQAYEEIRARNPQSPFVLYRLAYLDFVRGESERALPMLTALAANPKNPDKVRASALLYAGRAHDLAGRREEARKAYQRVVDVFDKQQRIADSARLGLLTPYRRPARK